MTTSATSPSPSKKNQRFSSNKSGTPPPKAPSRKFLPNIRENYTANYVQGPNAGGGNSNMPALSAQTQLASLRGALEAARLREEKHKTEMERTTKEMEMLKLEATTNRRREAEVHFFIFVRFLHPTYVLVGASASPAPDATAGELCNPVFNHCSAS